MVKFVPGDDETERPHRYLVLVGDAAAGPGVSGKSLIKHERRAAHLVELIGEVGQAALVESAVLHIGVLLEALDGSLVAAPDSQRTVGKNALAIADVADNLFQGPLVRRVPEVAFALTARADGARGDWQGQRGLLLSAKPL